MYFGVQNIHVNMNRFAVLIDENSLHVIFSDIAVNLGAALRHLLISAHRKGLQQFTLKESICL